MPCSTGRDFVINMKICVLAADVILDEEGDFVLVEISPHGQRLCMMPTSFLEYRNGVWGPSKYDGTEIFDLKADMILQDEFHDW